MVIVATMLLASCGGKGSSASAPTNVKIVAGDASVTISWDMQPGVEYWIWGTAGTSIDIPSCTSSCLKPILQASSPSVITGLTNGTTYTFSINGRTNGGPGGPGSAPVLATPRLAGTTWNVGFPLGTDLRGVAYGTPAVNPSGFGLFVAAGTQGRLFSSNDGISWSQIPPNNIPTTNNLNAVSYNSSSKTFVAVGDAGVVLSSNDGATWRSEISNTINNLRAITNDGSEFVAVGLGGQILIGTIGSNGMTWTPTSSINTRYDLYGITYAAGIYVAVGKGGAIFTSTPTNSGSIWTPIVPTPSTASDLMGVAYGVPQLAYVYTPKNGYTSADMPTPTFVAVGANGTLVTSPDGVTWTAQQNPISSNTLNAVTYGHQFIAVDNIGSIFTSIDGLNWQLAQNSSAPLYAVIPATYLSSNLSGTTSVGQYVYSAVGAGGANLLAQ